MTRVTIQKAWEVLPLSAIPDQTREGLHKYPYALWRDLLSPETTIEVTALASRKTLANPARHLFNYDTVKRFGLKEIRRKDRFFIILNNTTKEET